ncbi:MAG TPA: ABC transporter permease [Burkholderiaceae bacterium]|nr:ABC transporter permease [Burkholderiaceae bacterium]
MKASRLPQAALVLVLLFLLGPFLIVFIAGFSGEETLAFPPKSYSLRWISHVFTVESFQRSFGTSLVVGFGSTALALLLGVPVAYALSRYQFRGKELVRTLLTTPLIVPGIIVGLALLRYFVLKVDLPVVASLLAGHTTLLIPYAVRVVSASLANLRSDIDDAAITLGATRLQVFFKVILPNIRGGVAAAFILAFITSFNQVPVSLFLTGPGVSTLPIEMLSYMEFTFDPSIAALSTLLVVFTVVLVFITEKMLGITRYV